MMSRIGFRVGLAAILGSLAIHGAVLAASFDCGKATSPREQLICRDPVLSDLDTQLGRIYQERKAVLSQHGAELLQNSERNWLHYITTICPLIVPANGDSQRNPNICLKQNYQERLNQLARVGQKIGPFLFLRIDFFAAEPATDNTGSRSGFYIQHVAYPQIDNSASPEAEAWNKGNVRNLSEGDDCGQGDDDTDYDIGYASQKMISVQWSYFMYCHGTPHGMFWGETKNFVLALTPRPLNEEDVFGPTDQWVGPLQKIFWDALRKNGWSPPGNQAENVKADIEDNVIQPSRWFFTKEGLKVYFNAYEGGCYACTPDPVIVSWEQLKPLLSPTAVVP